MKSLPHLGAAGAPATTRLFDGFPESYRLDLVSSTEFSNGIVTPWYRRQR